MPQESGESSPGLDWIERREEQRGWRPRDAAYIIIVVWLVTVVVFGVLELMREIRELRTRVDQLHTRRPS